MKEEIIKGAGIVGKAISKHSSTILTVTTVFGIAGLIFTTSKAAVKTKQELDEAEFDAEEEGTEVTKKEKAKIIAKNYWPVGIVALGTTASSIANHKINTNRIKTATAAYEFTKEAYDTYRYKLRERLGEDAHAQIIEETVKDKVKDIDPGTIKNTGNGGVLFIESVTGQVFRASESFIRETEKRVNEYLRGDDWIAFNEWLYELGLRQMDDSIGDHIGFCERFGHDGINVRFRPAESIFENGETPTILYYEDPLCTEGDYRVLSW